MWLSATRSYSYVHSTCCLYEVPFRTIPRNNIHNTIIYRYFHNIPFNGFSQVEFCSTILGLTLVVIYFYFATNTIYRQWWYTRESATSWSKIRDAGESQGDIVSRLRWYRSSTPNLWSETTHRDLSRFDKYLTDIWSIKKKYTLLHRIVIFVQKILTEYCSRDSKISRKSLKSLLEQNLCAFSFYPKFVARWFSRDRND